MEAKLNAFLFRYRDGDLDPDVSESWENRVSSRTAQDTPLRPPLHQPQCGVRVSEAGAATAASTSSKTSPPSWALKIIGATLALKHPLCRNVFDDIFSQEAVRRPEETGPGRWLS